MGTQNPAVKTPEHARAMYCIHILMNGIYVLQRRASVSSDSWWFCLLWTEKAALLSPDDEVQKSDISSSSQGLVEKEALGPMLLEVSNTHTATHFTFHSSSTHEGLMGSFCSSCCTTRPSMVSSLSSTGKAASSLCPRTWRVTSDTPRRSWWLRVSTASFTWETTMNLFAICCLKAWVSETACPWSLFFQSVCVNHVG